MTSIPEVAIEPALTLSSSGSTGWALLVGGGATALFLFSLLRYLHYRGRVLRAQTISKQTPVLAPGPALLVGKVETDDASPAVRIEIDEVGTEHKSKNSWSHVWEERHRAIQVRPFRLRLPTEDVVSVLPDDHIQIVDDLVTERFEGTYRKRVAELSAGEQIWVSGVLSLEGPQRGPTTAYRAGATGWLLRGAGRERLEVASGGLERQFLYWRGFYRWAAGLCFGLALALHMIVLGPYLVLLTSGKVETLAVTRTSTFITTNKNTKTTHYVIHAQLPAKAGGQEVDDEVAYGLYRAATSKELERVPFIYWPRSPSLHAIGDHPSLSLPRTAIGVGSLVVALILFVLSRRHALPWYEQRKVVERGSGRLEESAWNIQVAREGSLFVKVPPKQPAPPGESDSDGS